MPNSKITGNVIGHRVQKARKKAGITQLELSTILAVDYSIELRTELISKIESGRRPVRDKEIAAITKVLGVTPNDLFGVKG